VVLEQEVILEGDLAQAGDNSTPHELFRVRSKSFKDFMIIPEVHHWNLGVGQGK
jgi:hypothetical protein